MVDSTMEKKTFKNFENNKNNSGFSFLNFPCFRISAIEKIRSSIILSCLIKEFKWSFFFSVAFSFIFEIMFNFANIKKLKIISNLSNFINEEQKSSNTVFVNEQKKFFISFVTFSAISSLFHFLKSLIISKIENDSFYFIKKTTIKKFLGLKIEDKISKKSDVSMINEEEAWIISEKWNHIAIHFSSSIFKIASLFLVPETREAILGAGKLGITSSSSFIIFSSFLNFWLFIILDKKREKLRIPVKEEAYLTEKVVSKAILIDNMGLKNEYLSKRDKIVRNLNDKYYDLEFFSNFFLEVLNLLCSFYPFFLLIFFFPFSDKSFFFLSAFKNTLDAFDSLAGCYRDVKIINFSLGIVDNFLLTASKNENELGAKLLGKEIISIDFENVSFAYANSEEDIVSDYSKSFTKSKVNKIEGKNGTGKSTVLYLILGTIEPYSGRIIVNTEDGESFDINKEINLIDWRENFVAYISHENLFESDEGSTGQKQMMNVDQIISEKKSAKIFLFDEADNSLDENNKNLFYKKVDELVSDNKIVILISH